MQNVLSLLLLLVAGGATPETLETDAFKQYWQGRQVYLLIPRDQGDRKGLLKTTHFEFRLDQPDRYERQVTMLHGELFFEAFRVRSLKCQPRHYEIHLSRPVLPNEEVLGPRVAVVLKITGESAISPEAANRILLTAVVARDTFPSVLQPGEGPYPESQSAVDLSPLLTSSPPGAGLTSQEVIRQFGPPLESRSVKIGPQEFQYWWYLGYRRFVLLEHDIVVRS